jgi:Uma2 family endonuclease
MGMPATRRDSPTNHRWTTAEVRLLIDESRHWPRYELIGGELIVTPAPAIPHQFAVNEIFVVLRNYLEGEDAGAATTSPADLELKPDTITQPDVFVLPARVASKPGQPLTWADVKGLILAVEIISPSSVRIDRVIKRDFYLSAGVLEYWIVDLDARMIERWTPSRDRPDVLQTSLEWMPPGAKSSLTIDVAQLFDRIRAQYQKLQRS